MTYGQKIYEMIEQIEKLYNEAEWLRDLATLEQKKHWNDHRRIFYDASKPLRSLYHSLSDIEANGKID